MSAGEAVESGDHIANLGEPKCHLHLSVLSKIPPPEGDTSAEEAVSIPYAFEIFEVCTPGGTSVASCTEWRQKKHDVPLNDQWFRWP